MLDKITKTKRAQPRRILLYGVHGIGKSTFAANAPEPIFLPTEDGLADIDTESFPVAESYAEWMENVASLYGDHGYKTGVLDSLDWLELLASRDICKAKGVQGLAEVEFGKGYSALSGMMGEAFAALGGLRMKGMTVVILAHQEIQKVKNPSGDDYDRYAPRCHKTVSAMAAEWADEVLFANYEVFTRTVDAGFDKKDTKATGSGRRFLYTTEKPSHMAKNRLDMPDKIEMLWDEYAKYLPK